MRREPSAAVLPVARGDTQVLLERAARVVDRGRGVDAEVAQVPGLPDVPSDVLFALRVAHDEAEAMRVGGDPLAVGLVAEALAYAVQVDREPGLVLAVPRPRGVTVCPATPTCATSEL